MTFHEHTLAALEAVEKVMSGGRWCSECSCQTNHDDAQHRAAAQAMEEEGRTEP